MLFITEFNDQTKEVTCHSEPMWTEDWDRMDEFFGEPIYERIGTPNDYAIYPDGVLISSFKWSTPPKEISNESLWY